MQKKVRVVFWILLITAVGFVNADHDRLRIGIHTFPLSVNPVYVTDETSQAVINKIFDSLFYFDENGDLKKSLLERYRINPDATEIVIDLMKHRYFSDGKELDSADVQATFHLLKNERIGYPYRSSLSDLANMKATGRYRLRIALKRKIANWKNLLTFKILNSREIKSPDPGKFRHKILTGTGPYRFMTVRDPEKLVLSRNPYDVEKSLFPYVEYLVISETRMKPLKLVRHEIDMCELQPEDTVAYRKIDGWQTEFELLKYLKFGYTYLVFNLRNNAITPNVRRIFYNRLVPEAFVERFLKNRGETVKTPFLLLNSEETPVKQRIEPLSGKIKLKILTNSESRLRKEFVLFLKQHMSDDGIMLDPYFLEYHTFIDRLKNGAFDIAVSGFLLDIDFDLKDVFFSDAAFNYGYFSHPLMDKLLDAGLSEMNPVKRKKLYLQANEIWKRELPVIPLFNLFYYMGVSKQVVVPDRICRLMGATGDFLINIRDWKTK